MSKLLIIAYELQASTPATVSPSSFLQSFNPLLRGQYPVFNQYPEFIINYQTKMRERIRKDEEEYLEKRTVAQEMNRLTSELAKDKKTWEATNIKTNDMLDTWWNKMTGEDQYLSDRKARIQALENDVRAKPIGRKASIENIESQQDLKKTGSDMYHTLENQWDQRKNDLLNTRKQIGELQITKAAGSE